VVRVQPFNICALISAHAAAIAGLAGAKNVSIVYDPCGVLHQECMEYRGDPARVGQVLRNVLINAVRYTPPGGSVHVTCDREGNSLTLAVRDSGPGIEKEDLPHIFEAGYRGRNTREKGSGLGLSVVSRLLSSLGGHARVESSDGSGVVFTIQLPAVHV
jgi:signal transduction histidine kinase